ncbi:alpha/beta fold hydrolase [Cellvibrio sp. OA-2007]|uniref:alpha/beta fold hydrolase n=1 Tax=Cellvibrio sp. OA-2007 TaxID=529823 RepID=UPI0007826B88|nr:alpha/beta hydrolase [Cellvibrio sp. OA-2007]
MKFYAFILLTLLCAQTAQANWLDKVGTIIDTAFASNPTETKAELIATSAAEHKLPTHWRSYWLNEPEFGARIFLADTGKISAPVLLLVHGLGQNGLRDWLPIVPELEKHYRVIMIDLPGFANSPSPKAKLSPTHYANLLHFVKPYFSHKPITVIGHSMGGAVTLRYAQRFPEDINQIALIDAAGILQRTAFVKHSATDRIPVNPEAVPNALLSYAIGLQDFSNNLIEKMLRLPDPTSVLGKSELAWGTTLQGYPNINAALSLAEESFASAIFEQTKPVFILWGSKDLVAPPRTGQLLAANLTSSNLTIIENAGHVPMASHPQEVSRWLLANLNTLPNSILKPAPQNTSTKQNYTCDHSTGDTLRGLYARITLTDCTGVLLDGVVADELIVNDSVIEVQHSHFMAEQISLTINKSVVMMTGGTINGLVKLNQARIDFAGVNLSNSTPFTISAKSRLVLSVSRASNNRYLHSDLQLENTAY